MEQKTTNKNNSSKAKQSNLACNPQAEGLFPAADGFVNFINQLSLMNDVFNKYSELREPNNSDVHECLEDANEAIVDAVHKIAELIGLEIKNALYYKEKLPPFPTLKN